MNNLLPLRSESRFVIRYTFWHKKTTTKHCAVSKLLTAKTTFVIG